jgi:hypothetical protein
LAADPEGELNYGRCLRLLGRWDLLDRSSLPTCNPPSDNCLAGLFFNCLKSPEAEYRECAVDHGHPKGELNSRRCLRLLSELRVPFRLSHYSLNLPIIDDLVWLLSNHFKKSGAFSGGYTELLASIDRLRVSIASRTHFHATIPEWSERSELGRGDLSIVTLSRCPGRPLASVKTASTAHGAPLIQREPAIHEKLKHLLVLEFREYCHGMAKCNSAILAQVAGNGSLASHLPSRENDLQG